MHAAPFVTSRPRMLKSPEARGQDMQGGQVRPGKRGPLTRHLVECGDDERRDALRLHSDAQFSELLREGLASKRERVHEAHTLRACGSLRAPDLSERERERWGKDPHLLLNHPRFARAWSTRLGWAAVRRAMPARPSRVWRRRTVPRGITRGSTPTVWPLGRVSASHSSMLGVSGRRSLQQAHQGVR